MPEYEGNETDAINALRFKLERNQARAERDKLAQGIVAKNPDAWTILDALMALDQARAWAKAWKWWAKEERVWRKIWQDNSFRMKAERDAALEALRGGLDLKPTQGDCDSISLNTDETIKMIAQTRALLEDADG